MFRHASPRVREVKEIRKAKDRLEDVNSGLFNYPLLMAADILMYDAHVVPVGKDQLQHIEITRNVANRFHNLFGETFVVPEGHVQEEVKLIPGTDGEKMSKSKNNIIDIFASEKTLKKQVHSIKTNSTPIEEPKDWKNCNLFNIYKLLASKEEIEKMDEKILLENEIMIRQLKVSYRNSSQIQHFYNVYQAHFNSLAKDKLSFLSHIVIPCGILFKASDIFCSVSLT